MIKVDYNAIVTKEKISKAIPNYEFIGFEQDYYVIHCLVSEWKPENIFEIGTSTGFGCVVMKNASPDSKIKTLDIFPDKGGMCPVGVEKLVGDSMTFNFSEHYPIDCWFIDGEHDYEHAYHETLEAIDSGAKYIIYHDADIPKVSDGIVDAFKYRNVSNLYDIYFVVNPPFIYSSSGENVTRVAYAVKRT